MSDAKYFIIFVQFSEQVSSVGEERRQRMYKQLFMLPRIYFNIIIQTHTTLTNVFLIEFTQKSPENKKFLHLSLCKCLICLWCLEYVLALCFPLKSSSESERCDDGIRKQIKLKNFLFEMIWRIWLSVSNSFQFPRTICSWKNPILIFLLINLDPNYVFQQKTFLFYFPLQIKHFKLLSL